MNEKLFSDAGFFHLIVQASPAGMIIADRRGEIVLANAQAERIFGYGNGELNRQPVEKLIPEAHAAQHGSHRARFMAHPEPRSMAEGRDLFGLRKDGSQVPVDISLHPFETDEGVFVLANILDATERREAARRRESQQAIERLALMGQLAGGVAHEIRTPLCVIRNNVYFLNVFAEKLGDEGTECLREIDAAIGKAERIVSELLDFTRIRPSGIAAVAVGKIIDHAVADVKPIESIEMRLPEEGRDWLVDADAEQIERILANLLRNAQEAFGTIAAMKEGEQPVVEIRLSRNDDAVQLDVIDNGPGIPAEAIERVFEPLFTTKATGIGLGLALSQRYAESNGGTLSVVDHPGRGTCFRLTLRPAVHRNDD